jgi:LPS-assembly protein
MLRRLRLQRLRAPLLAMALLAPACAFADDAIQPAGGQGPAAAGSDAPGPEGSRRGGSGAGARAGSLPGSRDGSRSAAHPDDSTQPTRVTADQLQGVSESEVTATGDAVLQRGTLTIRGDSLHYSADSDEVQAQGHVRIERLGDMIEGPSLRYRIGDSTGVFDKPDYSLAPRTRAENMAPVAGRGSAAELEFQGQDKFKLRDATFTTCKPGSEDWYAKVDELDLDFNRKVGTATSSAVYFYGTPIFYFPWVTFSLDNQRKSGFLPPSIGSTGPGGPEVSIPYYFNLAPNYDLTVTARDMQKRGLQWAGQFRFLEPFTTGEMSLEDLPLDHVTGQKRSAFTLNDTFSSGQHLSGFLNVSKVSDDAYFRDLSTRINLTSQTNLPREGYMAYGNTWWDTGSYTAAVHLQRFQTLQDPANPVVPPYARLPQLTLQADRQDYHGLDFSFAGEYVDFEQPTMVTGRRLIAYPSLSLPFIGPAGFFTPKIGVHATRYQLDQTNLGPGIQSQPVRVLPIMSLDTGLVFERPTELFGNSFTQTLEPRAYYLKVPFKDQSQIPLFDTAVADFNYTQIFSENSFVGGDRIADANQLTLAATTRLLSPTNGQEAMRALIGQRYYFADQKVLLNSTDTARTFKTSDWLASVSGRITQQWTGEADIDYDPREQSADRLTLSGRYQPEAFHTLNLSYRYLRDQLHQVDASAQWPLGNSGWYGVARYNYSIQDRRMVEGLAGFEYNGDCWVARLVVQRFAVATQQATNGIFLQLELNGFSRIGSNPLESLKRSIPGYSRLNQSPAPSANQTFDFFD